MEQPAWLAAAWGQFGVTEVAGDGDNPAILAYYKECGHDGRLHDETAWCAAFLGAMLARAGESHTGSLMARSYLGWGEPLEEARVGAIAVLERGSDPNAGHVGFVVGASRAKAFLLGGNQGNSVSVAAFDARRVLAYRWPSTVLTDATVSPQMTPEMASEMANAASNDVFERALAHVLKMEGGFSDDPYDRGGPTNRGITLEDYAHWKNLSIDATSRGQLVEALKQIPDDTVSAIYLSRYWRPAGCAELPAALALMHFDAAVNHGVGTAIRMLQQAAGADADGEIGALTRAAIAAHSVSEILTRYAELRRARYRGLSTFWRFGRGWLNRVDATEALAKTVVSETALSNDREGKTDMDQGFNFPLPGQTSSSASTPPVAGTMPAGKWWPQSKTVWGTLITALTTVLPLVGPLIGINIPVDVIKVLGDQSLVVIQALGGLIGTLLALYGRANAVLPLVRRDVKVRV